MENLAVRVQNVGKQYRLGGGAAYQTLRDSLASAWRSLNAPASKQTQSSTIWALDDISFEIPRGQAVSIIGRNGAGKSTLLKILSRITAPTRGSVDLFGRVGSLLEVGTGFHPELSGRENIYLNGAILGMRRDEIERKFDGIVAFAEIEKFLDTPVKFYSSGMYMRLAFSVAAHLEPEILLVDEVLAVGDAQFQKKALGKMGEVTQSGRTVLFVSHNLEAVQSLTNRAIVLNAGRIVFDGSADRGVQFYRRTFVDGALEGDYRNLNADIGVTQARVITSEGGGLHRFGEPLVFDFVIALNGHVQSFDFAFQVLNERSMPVINPRWVDNDRSYSTEKQVHLRCRLPEPRLYMGRYTLRTHLGDRASLTHYETVESVCDFEIVMDAVPNPNGWIPGACAYIEDVKWQIETAGDEYPAYR